jgi:glucosamine--fructose-6-phosphate aminotransferase (isomerizing)
MELLKIMSVKSRAFKRGYVFHSDTDTEVLVNLIEEAEKDNLKLGTVQVALNQVVGAYAIAVFDTETQMKLLLPFR